MQRIHERECSALPKVFQTNNIKKNKPAALVPNASADIADVMRFANARFAHDDLANGFGLRSTHKNGEFGNNLLDKRLVNIVNIVRRVEPNAFERANPAEIG